MEAYPSEYVEHNLPLVLLSGLGEHSSSTGHSTRQESGTRIPQDSPQCVSQQAHDLLQQCLRQDGSDLSWNPISLPGPAAALKYRMKAIGRTYTLPSRKAAPPPQSPSLEGFGSQVQRSAELHSPLSPLSPGSPVFPDGLFNPLWLAKHQEQVPSLFIAFFDINADAGSAQDDKLKADINAVRTAFSKSGFKTRFATVLLSDRSILHAPQLEDRLSSIRRATTLDPKTGLFFMPPMSSQAEIGTFVQSILTPLQPLVVEYYRDLTKHARRKKARGYVPQPTVSPMQGTSHFLGTVGWNVRYEVKQGAFAEFRQEMDVAERHYSFAVDELFNPEGMFETTSSWLPRWNEARLLCDALAFRILRCQLWNGETSGAAQSWVNYKGRMKDLIDRRGKGSQTYGWAAWEARWAQIMAQLIQRADLPTFKPPLAPSLTDSTEVVSVLPFAPPEKALAASERLAPFHHLHHAGYWHKLSALSTRVRRRRALTIPEEDRMPPSQSPASAVANRTQTYDTFLVPDPHEEYPATDQSGHDHFAVLTNASTNATQHFDARGQGRMSEQMQLDLGSELAGAARYEAALKVLQPLWEESSWRGEDWHDLFNDLLLQLYRCAQEMNDSQLVLATTWELLSARFMQSSLPALDLMECLDNLPAASGARTTLTFEDDSRCSPVLVRFAFGTRDSHVGEPLPCQVTLASRAREDSATITLSRVFIDIDPTNSVSITHEESQEPSASEHSLVSLQSPELVTGHFVASANLSIRPSQRLTFNFSLTFREANMMRVGRIETTVDTDRFRIRHNRPDAVPLKSDKWYQEVEGVLEAWHLPHRDTSTVQILPKPPKVQLLVHGMQKKHYLDEEIRLIVELFNGETEAVEGSITHHIAGQDEYVLRSTWLDADAPSVYKSAQTPPSKSHVVSSLAASESRKIQLQIHAPPEALTTSLSIELKYTLASDPSTILSKTLSLELPFVPLFESTFNFGPLLHSAPWPSYFQSQAAGTEGDPSGMLQKWRLGSHITSLAEDTVLIKAVHVETDEVVGDAHCKLTERKQEDTQRVGPQGNLDRSFEILTQKFSLDDRRPTVLDLSLLITWSREDNGIMHTTSLPMPRLTIPSSEPRVLCTFSQDDVEEFDAMLMYHIENPSMHFLTFAVTMEANEDSAFSGPKYRTLSIAPLSRHAISYKLVLQDNEDGQVVTDDTGRWVWPNLQVVDSYYQKTLKVQAAGPGIKIDGQKGLAVHISNR